MRLRLYLGFVCVVRGFSWPGWFFCAIFTVSLAGVVEISAASSKLWDQYRSAAKAALKNNDLEGAVENYALAFSEAETVFKGTDLRYLNTAIEAADLCRRL